MGEEKERERAVWRGLVCGGWEGKSEGKNGGE